MRKFCFTVLILGFSMLYGEDPLRSYNQEKKEWVQPSDPTRRFDIREQYQGFSSNRFRLRNIFRTDWRWPVNEDILGFRADLPYVFTDRDGPYKKGWGDLLMRGVLELIFNKNFDVQVGAEFDFPTCQNRSLGNRRVLFSPLLGCFYYQNNWFISVVFQNYFSISSPKLEGPFNELVIRPRYRWMFENGWYTEVRPDIVVDWLDHKKIFVPYTQEVGKVIGRKWIVTLRGSVPLIRELPRYNWEVQFRVSYNF